MSYFISSFFCCFVSRFVFEDGGLAPFYDIERLDNMIQQSFFQVARMSCLKLTDGIHW